MPGPMMQKVITYKDTKGRTSYVQIGYSEKAGTGDSTDPETWKFVVGEANLPRITLDEFPEISDDIPPDFVAKVVDALKNTPKSKVTSGYAEKVSSKKEITVKLTVTYNKG